jgi:signal transduction histidine kinase
MKALESRKAILNTLLLVGILFFIRTKIALFFIGLYLLSRFKSFKASSYLFVGTLLISAFYTVLKWGIDLPLSLFLCVFVILLTNIVINARFSLIVTSIMSFCFVYISILQFQNTISVDRAWKNGRGVEIEFAMLYAFAFFLIALIIWFYTKYYEKREKKIMEMYQLVKLGRLSSGFLHDLLNPLTALLCNLEQKKEMQEDLNTAFLITQKMRNFLISTKKQFSCGEKKEMFLINYEVEQVLEVLSYYIRKNKIEVEFKALKKIKLYGDPVKFSHAVLNIVSNAIDAYSFCEDSFKKIEIYLVKKNGKIMLCVRDFAKGVPVEVQNKIFKPFFTTKEHGIGIGLALVKNIIENDFNGNVYFKNNKGHGATFVVKIKG